MTLGNTIRENFAQFGGDSKLIATKVWSILRSERGYAVSRSAEPLSGIGDNPPMRIGKHAIEAHWPWAANDMHDAISEKVKTLFDASQSNKYLPRSESQIKRMVALTALNKDNLELGANFFLRPYGQKKVNGRLVPEAYIPVAQSASGAMEELKNKDGRIIMINPSVIYNGIDKDAREEWKRKHKQGLQREQRLREWQNNLNRGSFAPLNYPSFETGAPLP